MAPTYLDDIVAWHRSRAEDDHREWRDRIDSIRYDGPSMYDALSSTKDPYVKVIAEVKRRSPSKGWIDEQLDPAELALSYLKGGATAISVLTDEPHFAGSRDDVKTVRTTVELPVLRKDFTVSANDVIDTAEMGASTVLLIVAALGDDELRDFIAIARVCGLDALVEVHSDEEARRALDLGATIIGVNQRDLHSFEVKPEHAASVISSLASNVITVAESGMTSVDDVARAGAAGFHAVLVGETFVRAANCEQLVHSFASVRRTSDD
jgi:indole-3-glycerol phosphate synthase